MNAEGLNIVRREVQRALRDQGRPLQGTISQYDPNTYRAKVVLQPDNVESNWLPIASAWVGNGWGMLVPPPNGTQVTVVFQENDKDSGIIVCGLFDDSHAPPVGNPTLQQGELLLFHQSGTYIKLSNDGSLNLNSSLTVNIVATGAVNITGSSVNLNP